MPWTKRARSCFLGLCFFLIGGSPVWAQVTPQTGGPLSILDVPFISQSESLCGGAAAAMILRYWGERGLDAESFAHLVDRVASGIRTTALVGDLKQRGWEATAVAGTSELMAREISRGRPVLTLIQDRPGTFHYVVVVAVLPRAVIFHDPARAPFRVMSEREFSRRWVAADRWMAIVVPGDRPASTLAGPVTPGPTLRAPSSSCELLVADGVRQAQSDDLTGAERALTAALSCPGSAALRELAGVRVLQRRWPDVIELASAAVNEDPTDEHAWRLLATSRFIQNERIAALDAWNHVGEPRVDLLRVDGLARTRSRIVEEAIGIVPGDVLTRPALVRARRRLSELPSASSSSLDFVPVPSGRAELRAAVAERPMLPSDAWSVATVGLMAAVSREVRVATGPISGGGERIGFEWRFWPERPKVSVDVQAPAPWGGVWGVAAFTERQPFDSMDLDTSDRRSAGLTLSNWATSSLRWVARGGLDRWNDRTVRAHFGGGLRVASLTDRVTGQIDVDSWSGEGPFAMAHAVGRVQSSSERQGLVAVGTLGVGLAAHATPADLWFAGDTGHAGSIALRAHPLIDDGKFRVSQLGRSVIHGSMETQYWWRLSLARIGAAAFVDSARLSRRREPDSRSDVDIGGGARFSVRGRVGVLRIDLAKGLRDGATVLSLVYESSRLPGSQ